MLLITILEYICLKCGYEFEVRHGVNSETICPACYSMKTRRIFYSQNDEKESNGEERK